MRRKQRNGNNKLTSFILHLGTSGTNYAVAQNFRVLKTRKAFKTAETQNTVS